MARKVMSLCDVCGEEVPEIDVYSDDNDVCQEYTSVKVGKRIIVDIRITSVDDQTSFDDDMCIVCRRCLADALNGSTIYFIDEY